MGCIYFETVFNDFVSNILSSLVNGRYIVILVYYFQIWNKREDNIIIKIFISSHKGAMYIEAPCKYLFMYVCMYVCMYASKRHINDKK